MVRRYSFAGIFVLYFLQFPFWNRLDNQILLPIVLVSNVGDASNGDTSTISSLIANPGADGISLREALEAANNTPGAKEINFAAALKGSSIIIGATTLSPLPSITTAGLTLDGDVDGDGKPDITLDGILGSGGGPLSSGFTIAASDTTLRYMAFDHYFGDNIDVGISPETPMKTIRNVKIEGNVIYFAGQANDATSISVTMMGMYAAAQTDHDAISNLVFEDILVTGNTIIAQPGIFNGGIFIMPAAFWSKNNRLSRLTIADNYFPSGGNIGVVGADTNSRYHNPNATPPYDYSENNLIEDVTVTNNRLFNSTGINFTVANFGNQYNKMRRLTITNNEISGSPQAIAGIGLGVGGGGTDTERQTSHNLMQNVVVRGNYIHDIKNGIYVSAGGSGLDETAPGETDNILTDLLIDDNRLERLNEGGVRIYAGIIEHPGVLVANNLIQNVTVSNNRISDSTEYGQGIWIAGGWHSAWASEGETTPARVTNNQIINLTLLGNVVRKMHEGLTLYGGDGLGTTGNSVTGVGMANIFQDSIFHNQRISANVNGASDNILSWEWKLGPYIIFLPMLNK